MFNFSSGHDVDGELGHLHLVVELEDAVEVVCTTESILK
jgi:hypothetical protein